MAYRIHVHTKHDIEYGKGHFNCDQEAIYTILSCLGAHPFDGQSEGYGDDITVRREYLEFALKSLQECIDNDFNDAEDIAYDIADELYKLYPCHLTCGETVVDLAKKFKAVILEWLSDAPEGSEFIYFSWF